MYLKKNGTWTLSSFPATSNPNAPATRTFTPGLFFGQTLRASCMIIRQSALACDFSEIAFDGVSRPWTAVVAGFTGSSGIFALLPGTERLCDVENARKGLMGVTLAIRDGIGNRRRGDRAIGLRFKPGAARQVVARHGGLALIRRV
jgi:hypothetical protein